MPEITVGNEYFSTLDLAMAFYQVEFKEKDREKLSFSVNHGKLTRMPMGLKISPAIFQRVIDDVLREYIGKICHVYIDNIIVFGKDLEVHAQNLRTILCALDKASFKVQPDKSEFFTKEVAFLGFTVSGEGIKPSEDKVTALKNFPDEPTNIRELHSFLGLLSYYRRFIYDYARLAKPFTNLLKGSEGHKRISKSQSKKCPVTFNNEGRSTSTKLKETLTSEDVLIYPNMNDEFNLTTDASDYAIGAVLS